MNNNTNTKLLNSIISFNKSGEIIKNHLFNFQKNNQNCNQQNEPNIDEILYLKQISHFSKIKYINTNFKQIEEKINQNNQYDEYIAEFWLKKLNIFRKIPTTLLSNLEQIKYKMIHTFHKAKAESNHKLAHETLIQYSKKTKELTDIIAEQFPESKSKYDALIKFHNPFFDCDFFEQIFSQFAPYLKQVFNHVLASSKCIKTHNIETSSLKNDLIEQIHLFLKEHFSLLQPNNTSSSNVYIYENHYLLSPFKQNTNHSFKNLIENKSIEIIKNFVQETIASQDQQSEISILFHDFRNFDNFHILTNFIINFYITSQNFLEELISNLKKNNKIKGKSFENNNLFWIFNGINNDPKSLNIAQNHEICTTMIAMIQYVLEKDFINENIKPEELIEAWQNGIKHYFDCEVDPMHFIENFNPNPMQAGLAGYNIFSSLKSAEFFNNFHSQCINKNNTENPTDNSFNITCKQIIDFEKNFINNPLNNQKFSINDLIANYQIYIKNKFGINI